MRKFWKPEKLWTNRLFQVLLMTGQVSYYGKGLAFIDFAPAIALQRVINFDHHDKKNDRHRSWTHLDAVHQFISAAWNYLMGSSGLAAGLVEWEFTGLLQRDPPLITLPVLQPLRLQWALASHILLPCWCSTSGDPCNGWSSWGKCHKPTIWAGLLRSIYGNVGDCSLLGLIMQLYY